MQAHLTSRHGAAVVPARGLRARPHRLMSVLCARDGKRLPKLQTVRNPSALRCYGRRRRVPTHARFSVVHSLPYHRRRRSAFTTTESLLVSPIAELLCVVLQRNMKKHVGMNFSHPELCLKKKSFGSGAVFTCIMHRSWQKPCCIACERRVQFQ